MKRLVRVLLPWLERHDAVAAQFGFRLPEPGEDISAETAAYERQSAARFARPPFAAPSRAVEPLPAVIAERGQRLLAALATALEGDASRLRAGIVDLTELLSMQKAVCLDDIEQRVALASADDWTGLAEICLPEEGGDATLQGTYDRDGKGLTITSVNPNLRVTPVQNFLMPGSGVRVIGFQVVFGTAHVHVISYRGRLILKDGYHRCYGLLARGITAIPCIIEEARGFSDVQAVGSTLIGAEDLLGSHPPRLADFHDPELSMTLEQQNFRKTIRISAEEFVVNV
jgi:hypothetical protein